MGIFDKGVEPEEFEKYKKSIELELETIRYEIKKSTSESAAEADTALHKINIHKKESENHTEDIKNLKYAIQSHKNTLDGEVAKLNETITKANNSENRLATTLNESISLYESAKKTSKEIEGLLKTINSKISEIDGEIEKSKELPGILKTVTTQESEIKHRQKT